MAEKEKEQFYSDDFFKYIMDNMYEGIYFCSRDRKITYWNTAAEKMTGYTAAEVIGSHCWNNILMHTDEKGESLCKSDDCPAVKAMKGEKLVEEQVFLKHKDGYRLPVVTRISPVKDPSGKVIGAIEMFSDNSAKVSAFQKIEKLEKLAFIDELTGVGNRRYSEIKVGSKLEEMERYAWAGEFGLLFIDIDKFKQVNDTYGHDIGDRTLKVVARTILNNLREEDFVGRWGGEEFVATIANVDNKILYSIAEKLRGLVANSHINSGKGSFSVTISIGATMAKRGDETTSIVKRADVLMYNSKNEGRNFVTIG
jgi:diguanylate cyclase (GGDEF)-like protein/PAS domain S-box-containing protein